MLHGPMTIRGPHGMKVAAVRLRRVGAAVHGVHLDEGRERRIERGPVDATCAETIADVMRKCEGAARQRGLEPRAQFGRTVGENQRRRIKIAIDDRVVAKGSGMDLVAREDDEPVRIRRRQGCEVSVPALTQLGEALDVEIDDVCDARVVDGHIWPVGVSGDRDEVELQRGPRERIGKATVSVTEVAVIVDVPVQRHEAEFVREWHQSCGKRGADHMDESWLGVTDWRVPLCAAR